MRGEEIDPSRCLFIDPGIERLDRYLAQLSQPAWEEGIQSKIKLVKRDDDEPSPDLYDATALAFSRDSERGLQAKAPHLA